ncbi:hypothetical protein VTL71DRAFT_6768 [Oculimacula yallundae]|uniref:Exonuclease domain-containing protein n=1 Tax=Oculimacula yallundae TaxID=86028 RepID=A0ABR4BYK5_9HELO
MVKPQREITKDRPQSSSMPNISRQSDANKSSFVLPFIPKQSDTPDDRPILELLGNDLGFPSEMILGTSSVNSIPLRDSGLSLEYIQRLRNLLASKTALEETGYVLQPLSEYAIQKKKRCERCGKVMLKGRVDGKGQERKKELLMGGKEDKVVNDQRVGETKDEIPLTENSLFPVEGRGDSEANVQSLTVAPTPILKPYIRCRFHDGVVKYKTWSCCRQHTSSDPCQAAEFHLARTYPVGELESLWAFYPTPNGYPSHEIRAAVAIDCEMGNAKSGDSELIRVTLIDYFSSDVLVDKLVYPDVAMAHYNTRFSGVTGKQMENARFSGQCLMGKKRAREAVWRFVGPHTIVVGHSAHNDLTAMRWIHTVVVDTWLLESEKKKAREADAKAKVERGGKEQEVPRIQSLPLEDAVELQEVQLHQEIPKTMKKKKKGSGALSLKILTWKRLGREIQTAGREGHDSLEDAIATRDLAHWNVIN